MTAETTAESGAEGFYVSVERGRKHGLLLGPELTREAAEARVPEGRRLAVDLDPAHAFDGFGVTRVQMRPGAELPVGKLNALAAEHAQADKEPG